MDIINTIKEEKVYSSEEYHHAEELAPNKNEFRNGKIIPMPGGSSNHADIIGNIYICLRMALKSSNFRVFNSELKIHIKALNQNVYPDSSVVLSPPNYQDNKFAVTNPILVVEVLSDSTAKYDRGQKFLKYKAIPTFKEYVLIDQDVPMVDVLTLKDKEWVMTTYVGLEDIIVLPTLNCTIPMKNIYENVEDLEHPQGVIDFEK